MEPLHFGSVFYWINIIDVETIIVYCKTSIDFTCKENCTTLVFAIFVFP